METLLAEPGMTQEKMDELMDLRDSVPAGTWFNHQSRIHGRLERALEEAFATNTPIR